MTALLGDFGMGKTVTCQMLTQRLLERLKADPARTPLPIYLDLREIADAKAAGGAKLETLMADMLRRVGEAAPPAPAPRLHRWRRATCAVEHDRPNRPPCSPGSRWRRAAMRTPDVAR